MGEKTSVVERSLFPKFMFLQCLIEQEKWDKGNKVIKM